MLPQWVGGKVLQHLDTEIGALSTKMIGKRWQLYREVEQTFFF